MNTITYFFVDVLKFVLAGTLIVYIAWQMIKSEIEKISQSKLLDLKKASLETTLPIR